MQNTVGACCDFLFAGSVDVDSSLELGSVVHALALLTDGTPTEGSVGSISVGHALLLSTHLVSGVGVALGISDGWMRLRAMTGSGAVAGDLVFGLLGSTTSLLLQLGSGLLVLPLRFADCLLGLFSCVHSRLNSIGTLGLILLGCLIVARSSVGIRRSQRATLPLVLCLHIVPGRSGRSVHGSMRIRVLRPGGTSCEKIVASGSRESDGANYPGHVRGTIFGPGGVALGGIGSQWARTRD